MGNGAPVFHERGSTIDQTPELEGREGCDRGSARLTTARGFRPGRPHEVEAAWSVNQRPRPKRQREAAMRYKYDIAMLHRHSLGISTFETVHAVPQAPVASSGEEVLAAGLVAVTRRGPPAARARPADAAIRPRGARTPFNHLRHSSAFGRPPIANHDAFTELRLNWRDPSCRSTSRGPARQHRQL